MERPRPTATTTQGKRWRERIAARLDWTVLAAGILLCAVALLLS
ncbi:MAG: hypothetical protein ACM3O6_06295 [Acidobacteriota bacterium]